MATKDNVLISKLGIARGVERSRIWIEGARLVAAGFKVGKVFTKHWTDKKLVLRLALPNDTAPSATVTGKGDKPIIDIVGAMVRDTFPDATHVKVKYDFDLKTITITASEAK